MKVSKILRFFCCMKTNFKTMPFIERCEDKYAQVLSNLRKPTMSGFTRQVAARITAAALPIFAIAMIPLKLLRGIVDLAVGTFYSLRDRDLDIGVFSSNYAKPYFTSLGKSILGAIVGTPLALIAPDQALKFLQKEQITMFTDEIIPLAPQNSVDTLYKGLETVDGVFRKHDIAYCLDGGSLLGAVRHGGLIPWDDDADLVILDENKLLASAEDLKEKGFNIVKFWTGYKICPVDGEIQETADVYDPASQTWIPGAVTYPFIDIFVLQEEGDKYVISDSFPDSKKIWPHEHFTKEEWNTIEDVSFGDLTLRGLNSAEALSYLERTYGEDWNSVAYRTWDHQGRKGVKKVKVELVNRQCAKRTLPEYGLKIDHQGIAENALNTMTDEEMDRQWNLKNFFGTIQVINLDRDVARMAAVQEHLGEVGLEEGDFDRFKGCYGREELSCDIWNRIDSNYKHHDTSTEEGRRALDSQHMGQAGCYMSHYNVIKQASENYDLAIAELVALKKQDNATAEEIEAAEQQVVKYSSVLILEDDNEFGMILPEDVTVAGWNTQVYADTLTHEGVGKIFYQGMRDLPEDWDMLYFMAQSYRPPLPTASPHLKKLREASCLNAYAVSAKMYRKLLARLGKIEHGTGPILPIDEEIAILHKTTGSYVFAPALAVQDGRGSSINDNCCEEASKRYWQCTTDKLTPAPKIAVPAPSVEEVGTDATFKRTDQEAVDKIYSTLDTLDSLLREAGIKYCMCGGTQLGATRQVGEKDGTAGGGLIPWDDDGDIAIQQEDLGKFVALKEEFDALGFELVEHKFCWKLQPKDGKPYSAEQEVGKNGETLRFPNVDIFVMKERERGKYALASDEAFNMWSYEHYTKDEWESISDVAFGPLRLMGLQGQSAASYLDRGYCDKVTKTPTWRTEASRWWDHETAQRDDTGAPSWTNIKVLKLVDFSHAQPSSAAL